MSKPYVALTWYFGAYKCMLADCPLSFLLFMNYLIISHRQRILGM